MNIKKELLPIGNEWDYRLKNEFNSVYFNELMNFLELEFSEGHALPPVKKILNAFRITPPEKTKVIIIGQDPYHGIGQANGLAFSVNADQKLPPSLKNIFKELKNDLNINNQTGDLSSWAEQGVLLLNACLSVRVSEPASHQNKGWEQFTDAVIQHISDEMENIVFILWGNFAIEKGNRIDTNKHHILRSTHPSPFSANRGFFNSKPFSRCNEILIQHNKEPINWLIPNKTQLF